MVIKKKAFKEYINKVTIVNNEEEWFNLSAEYNGKFPNELCEEMLKYEIYDKLTEEIIDNLTPEECEKNLAIFSNFQKTIMKPFLHHYQ